MISTLPAVIYEDGCGTAARISGGSAAITARMTSAIIVKIRSERRLTQAAKLTPVSSAESRTVIAIRHSKARSKDSIINKR